MKHKAVIVCGPTAGGKTGFAHEFAKKHNGEVVNADSMQIYKQIPIITASPSNKLKTEINYHLYNFLSVDTDFSAVKYVKNASNTIQTIAKGGKLPIITGGTGLYIDMLTNGYHIIPEIRTEIRYEARNQLNLHGNEHISCILQKLDPQIINHINIADKQRLLRAYEIFLQTGKSILDFYNEKKYNPLPDFEFQIYLLMPSRDFLYQMCNKRFSYLFSAGALEEIRSLKKDYPNLQTTASKALGIEQIIDYLNGKIDKETVIASASMQTRRYAKRQCTWFKNQLTRKITIHFNNQEEYLNGIQKL
ncbi:MAG TPA: tRNA (adenosine(37)-N6)-dimethylallyltransferase MiaA [Candidatus Megaira endosymbiont of Nemacystus decipiens]|nr:tRNA (adenosine(37)-N6)-dimethylallyltransferase MiaA [Candidatus Megaera endosymbiont of Nemacystus decipiens]